MINKLESSLLNGVDQRTRRTGAQFRKDGVVLEGLGTVLSREGVFLRIQFFFLHPTIYSFFQTYETFFFRIIINIRYSARVVVVLLRIQFRKPTSIHRFEREKLTEEKRILPLEGKGGSCLSYNHVQTMIFFWQKTTWKSHKISINSCSLEDLERGLCRLSSW